MWSTWKDAQFPQLRARRSWGDYENLQTLEVSFLSASRLVVYLCRFHQVVLEDKMALVGAQRHPLASAANSRICTWTPQPTQESPSEVLYGRSQVVCAVWAMCGTRSPFNHSASCPLIPCLNSEGILASDLRKVVSALHSLIGSWKRRTGTLRGAFK